MAIPIKKAPIPYPNTRMKIPIDSNSGIPRMILSLNISVTIYDTNRRTDPIANFSEGPNLISPLIYFLTATLTDSDIRSTSLIRPSRRPDTVLHPPVHCFLVFQNEDAVRSTVRNCRFFRFAAPFERDPRHGLECRPDTCARKESESRRRG